MPRPNKVDSSKSIEPSGQAAALVGNYLRALTTSMSRFAEFDQFLDSLHRLVGEDAYLNGTASIVDPFSGAHALPDFEKLEDDETIVAVAGEAGNIGHLKYSGRKDGQLFGAEDMHLMGAIAGLIAALVKQAEQYQQKSKAAQILQFLINQLPLGVICFDSKADLIVESKLASRLLGEQGDSWFKEAISQRHFQKGKVQLHFEIDERLIFSEGRAMKVDEGTVIYAFVLYDMSASRNKLLVDLETAAYRSESRGVPMVLAVLESQREAGEVYAFAKAIAEALKLDIKRIQPLGAYRCVCVFEARSARSVRFMLNREFAQTKLCDLRASVVSYQADTSTEAPAQVWLTQAVEALQPIETALMPELIVLDRYPAVFDSLRMILSECCQLTAHSDVSVVGELIRSGRIDGLFFDLDNYSAETLAELKAIAETTGGGFRFFYCTCKRRSMVDTAYALKLNDLILQKPFDANEVIDVVSLQFDLA